MQDELVEILRQACVTGELHLLETYREEYENAGLFGSRKKVL